ncbi:hypothetical protein LJC41_01380 [Desulfosarcina sp. OttesenSCG-928-G17]|nr:hypothetical protein [Desulfosarcina sp. OttesenSCG-928-G17]
MTKLILGKKATFLFLLTTILFLTGCGTLTGIPSHGGGKRFAIEQELISASARSALKDLNIEPLMGKRVALFVTVIGDEGSGNLAGGRYTIDALVRGEYVNTPTTTTKSNYPVIPITAVTTSGDVASVTQADTALNSPLKTKTETEGGGFSGAGGLHIGGQGNYQNETLITNPRDVTFLTNLIQTIFFLRGVDVVPPNMADTDVFVTVDVFGTIRNRTEWNILNQERLIASTKLEIFGVDRETKTIILSPRVSAFEAKYEERFALWVGPYKTEKNIKRSAPLLVDFSDVEKYQENVSERLPYTEEPIIENEYKNSNINIKDPIMIRETRERELNRKK